MNGTNRRSIRREYDMASAGKGLIIIGGMLMLAGLALVFSPKIPFLGKLPGDIHIQKNNFELYIPLATCLLLSIIVTGIVWVTSYFAKK